MNTTHTNKGISKPLTNPKCALRAKTDFTNSPNLEMGQTYLLARTKFMNANLFLIPLK